MDNQDKESFAKIMLVVADNFRDTMTPEGIQARFLALRDYSIEQIERAAWKIMVSRKYTKMPTVAEFFEALGASAPKIESVALAEAYAVIKHLRLHGRKVSPKFKNPITRRLMRSRWPYLQWAATVKDDELKWWVKEFCEAYVAFSETRPDLVMLEQTPGSVRRLLGDIGKGGKT